MKTEINLDLALQRWATACVSWEEMAAGHRPYLPAFLAGWFCRQIGMEKMPEGTEFKDSFRKGWKECEIITEIFSREGAQ